VDNTNIGVVYDQLQFHYSLNILSDGIKVDWSKDRNIAYADIPGIVYNSRGTALLNYTNWLNSGISLQHVRDLAHHPNIKNSFNPVGTIGSMGWHFSSIGTTK